MPGASIYWEGDVSTGVVSDLEGKFSIQIRELPDRLVISFVGYQTSNRVINPKDLDKELKFFLSPDEMSLDEIIIQEVRPDEQVKNLETGIVRLPIESIKEYSRSIW